VAHRVFNAPDAPRAPRPRAPARARRPARGRRTGRDWEGAARGGVARARALSQMVVALRSTLAPLGVAAIRYLCQGLV